MNTNMTIVVDMVDKVTSEMKTIQAHFEGFQTKLKSMEPAFKSMAGYGTVAFGAVSAVAGLSVKAYAESQEQLTRVDTALRGLVGATTQVSSGMQKVSVAVSMSSEEAEKARYKLENLYIEEKELTMSQRDLEKQMESGKITTEKYALEKQKLALKIGQVTKEANTLTSALEGGFTTSMQEVFTTVSAGLGTFEEMQTRVGAFGAKLQALGGIGDETASEGLTKLLQTTKNFADAENAAMLAADLATYKQVDYATAVQALNGVLAGKTMILKQLGFEVDENTTKEQALAMIAGRTAGQYEEYGKTISGQMAIIGQSIGDMQENIGKAFLPVVSTILPKVQEVIDKFIAWTAENPKLIIGLTGAALAVSGIVAGLGFLGLSALAVTSGIGAISKTMTALKGINLIGALTSPWLLAALAIAAVVAVGYLIYKNWDAIKAVAASLWESIKNAWNGITQSVSDAATSMWNTITGWTSSVVSAIESLGGLVLDIFKFWIAFWVGAFDLMGIDIVGIWTAMTTGITVAWTAVSGYVSAKWTELVAFATGVFTALSAFFSSVWNTIAGVAGSVWESVSAKISAVWQEISDVFNTFMEPLKEVWSSFWEGLGEIVAGVWSGIKDIIKDSINFVISGINKVINALNSIAQIGAGRLGMKIPTLSNIPMLATGGIVNSPTLAMIGEAGPEAVVPLRRYNAAMGFAGAGAGVSGGITINLSISGNTYMNDRDMMRKVGGEMVKYLKDNMRL